MRGVIVYLTLGMAYVAGTWTWILSKHPHVFERLREQYGEFSGAARRRFWLHNLAGPIALWPASLAYVLFILLAPSALANRLREKYATQFRRDFIDDDRMRRALEPEMPAGPLGPVIVDVETFESPAEACCCVPTQAGLTKYYEDDPLYERCGQPAVLRYRTVYSDDTDRVTDFCAEHRPPKVVLGEEIDAEFESP